MKMKMKAPKYFWPVLIAVMALCLLIGGCTIGAKILEVPAEGSYSYVNPDETKAEPDAGMVIDGVLNESVYQNNNWLHLSNQEGGADVEIAMTSYFGEKGMYFVYDVTEGTPIYVNLDRPSYLNSCIEMYLAPNTVNNMKGNSVFEIDMLPSGHLSFKKSNGKGGFVDVAANNDIMAYLGTTTKGGELNTEECYGYCLELFIPWEYMERFKLDAAAMQNSYVYAGPCHITSFNYAGTDMDVDRYWYTFTQQHGASYSNVYQYFRFDGKGVQGTVPVELVAGEHYTIEGATAVIPGMQMNVTVTPETGYALDSILINGKDYIEKAQFNEDGSVTIRERGVRDGVKISATAVAVTEGNKTVTGTVKANKLSGGSLKNVSASYKGPTGERPLELGSNGKFTLENLKQGYYTFILEKPGYKKLERSVYVNRDMEVQLSLEYDLFTATGNSWVLDEQNDGMLYKFGGSGELLTNDSYKRFTASATFRFDKEVEKSGTTDTFKQQRQGLKFVFGNGKTWHIDLLKEDGKYYVQYAKHSGDKSMTGWKKIHALTASEIAKFTGEKGICLSVQRDGKFANVYLDGNLIALETLEGSFATSSAQIGFEAWAAKREVTEIPFKIVSADDIALYDAFTVKANFKFDQKLEKKGSAAAYTEQRQGLKIAFSNGKVWHIDLLKQDGKYVVQYAKHSGENSLTGWKKIYTLSEAEIAQYCDKKGIELSVQRDGKYANVYLGGKLIALEIMDDAYASVSAQVAMETWVANLNVKDIPNTVVPATSVDLEKVLFLMEKNWDVSQQYNNLLILPEGGFGKLPFMEKQGNINLTLKARDYKDSKDEEGIYPRTDLLFAFDNGKLISFSVNTKDKTIQSVYHSEEPEKNITTGWKTWGKLTAEEAALLQADGVDFKVIRYGTEVTLYIGDRMVAVADLTANGSGVTADMKATVSVRHYEDAGVRVEIPFQLSNTYDLVNVKTGDNLAVEKKQYFVGDIVNVSAKDESNCITSLKVNGKAVAVRYDGTYSFTAKEKEYAITGEVEKSIFKPDAQWDLQKQNAGVISIPKRTGNYASIVTTDSTYLDAAVTVKDMIPTFAEDGKGNFQMQIRFTFANGKMYQVRLHNTDADGKYKIQTMGGDNCITGWKWHKDLTAAQTAKLQNEGVQFRVMLVDTTAMFWLDGVNVATYDISAGLQNNGLKAGDTAQIQFTLHGNNGAENVEIPFILSGDPAVAKVQIDNSITFGAVTASKTTCIAGETVTITATPEIGYYLKSLTVKKDGKDVQLTAADGKYSFVSEKGNYTVSAAFEEAIKWTMTDENGAVASAVERGNGYITFSTTASAYREAGVTVRDVDPTFGSDGKGNFQMQIRFVFADGKQYQVRLHNTDADGKYKVQNMGGTNCITGWKWLKDLTNAQTTALQTGNGVVFRVVLAGSDAELYLDTTKIATVDLSSGGINAASLAQIRFVMYGNVNAQGLEISCTVKEGAPMAQIQTASNGNGTVSLDKPVCAAGETVTATVTPATGYNLKGLVVKKNGQVVNTMDTKIAGGNYTFTVTEVDNYTVEAEFAAPIFTFANDTDKNNWNVDGQYMGTTTITGKTKATGGYARVLTAANTYRDVSVTVSDLAPTIKSDGKGNFKMQIYFTFANGKQFQVRLHNENAGGVYTVQNMSSSIISSWTKLHTLTDAQVQKVQSEAGINFRIQLSGTNALIYLDGVQVASVNLSAGISSGATAQITMIMYGNDGVEPITVPFTLG